MANHQHLIATFSVTGKSEKQVIQVDEWYFMVKTLYCGNRVYSETSISKAIAFSIETEQDFDRIFKNYKKRILVTF